MGKSPKLGAVILYKKIYRPIVYFVQNDEQDKKGYPPKNRQKMIILFKKTAVFCAEKELKKSWKKCEKNAWQSEMDMLL